MDKTPLFNFVSIDGQPISFTFPHLNKTNYGYGIIANGYKEAFNLLVKELMDRKKNNTFLPCQNLIFPIIFLLRQACELSLKELLLNCQLFLDIPKSKKNIHSLVETWKECSELLDKIDNKYNISAIGKNFDYQNAIETMGSIINSINEVDETSQTFRYPEDQKGNSLLNASGIHTLDLHNIHEKGMYLLKSFLIIGSIIDFLRIEKDNPNH